MPVGGAVRLKDSQPMDVHLIDGPMSYSGISTPYLRRWTLMAAKSAPSEACWSRAPFPLGLAHQ
jgi:hypothetical protein